MRITTVLFELLLLLPLCNRHPLGIPGRQNFHESLWTGLCKTFPLQMLQIGTHNHRSADLDHSFPRDNQQGWVGHGV